MESKGRNKKIRNIISIISITTFTAIIAVFLAFLIGSKNDDKDGIRTAFIDYKSYYDGTQVPVKETSEPKSSNEISMTDAYGTTTDYSSMIITIATAEELWKFSASCNNNAAFLAYDYKLLCNIDYDDYTEDFIPIGWSSSNNNTFTGSFDGQGYEIKNLELFVLNSQNYSLYASMEYLAMFSKIGSGASIKNFGLIDPVVTLAATITSMQDKGVANVCGLNNGTIDSVYVNQLSTKLVDECGITVVGGYRVSGFVAENGTTGEIKNSYLATNSVYNFTIADEVIEFADIALKDSSNGGITNTYFYNTSIDSSSTIPATGAYSIVFSDDLGAKAKTGTNYPGLYVETTDDLNSKYSSNTSWSIKGSNEEQLNYYYKYDLPVKRTFKNNPTVTIKTENDKKILYADITIEDVNDLLFMYELMNNNSFFASNTITYKFTKDINLKEIPAKAYAYNHAFGATVVGQTTEGSITLQDGTTSSYPTIYNADILNSNRLYQTTGVDCYGMFNYLVGSVSNINFVSTINLNDIKESVNVKGIGLVSGYVERGRITNVNSVITATNTTSSKLGEYYIGAIAGVCGGEASITNSSANGSYNIVADSTYSASTSYMQGCAIGGAIGYIESSLADIDTLLSNVNINTELGSSATYAVGGVIGAAYTRTAKNLENIGSINVGTTSKAPTYTKLYVSGVIGRHLGETGETSKTAEVNNFTNQGDITVYGNSDATFTYVSGVLNADIMTKSSQDGSLSASQFVDKANNVLFYASALANRANVSVCYDSASNALNTNSYLSNVLNICTGNGFDATVSSIYNLDNSKKYEGTSKKLKKITTSEEVDISAIPNYAGCINVINYNTKTDKAETSGNNITTATSIYNLRDINFKMSAALSANINASGVINGKYINYSDIRNEGNLSFTLDKESSTTAYALNVSGVFSELSLNRTAENIYNGGNITITDSADADMKINIYVSGICYSNLAVLSNDEQNPIKSKFNSSLVGSLNNVINNGKITVTSSDLDKSLAATKTDESTNKPVNTTQTTTTNLNGHIYASGISYMNTGVISNAFNLGDIDLEVFALANGLNYYAAGITSIMDGNYAQVRDSANNGTLQVINMCNSKTANVLVGGIFATNVYNNHKGNINQTVAFAINYGTLIGFSGYANSADANIGNIRSFVGGVSAKGICNIANILNYGNIYGSTATGSIIGAFDMSSYDSDNVYLANTINYSSVYALTRSKATGAIISHANYNTVASLDFIGTGEYNATRGDYYYLGSMFGYINFNSQTNINVRYVINFFNGAYITQEINQKNISTDGIDTKTFITVNGSLDKFGGSSIKYAPLSTVEDSAGNIGVFSKKFIFRRAIDGDLTAVDYDKYVTDAYIADFFQFVRFDKVNEIILEKIGWKNLAYLNAAEQLAKDVKTMAVFVNDSHAKLTKTTDSVKASFESDTWYSNLDETLLENFLTEVLSKDNGNTSDFDSDALKELINYILFNNECISDVSSSVRSTIVNTIVSYYDKEEANYKELLQKLLYDELLAKVVSGDDTNYIEIQNKIRTILVDVDDSKLETVLHNYLEALLADTTVDILSPLFETLDSNEDDYYLNKKVELIQTLLSGYSDDVLATMVKELLTSSSEDADHRLFYSSYLSKNTDLAIEIYSKLLIANNFNNSYMLESLNKSLVKYNVSSIINDDSFDTSSIENNYSVLEDYSWINGTKWTYDRDYTELWNIVKNNTSFQNYISINYFQSNQDPTSSIYYNSIIAKATEYNNTYQSNDGPSAINETDNTLTRNNVQILPGENLNSTNFGSYNINNGGVFRNSDGDKTDNPYQPGIKGKNQVIKNRFVFTPDEVNSYATNYYGPYMATGEIFAKKWKITTYTTYKGYELYNVSSSAAKMYVPAFISTSKTITQNAIDNSHTDATNKTISDFLWNNYNKESSRYQWVSDYICEMSPEDSWNYLYKNYNTTEYVNNYYDFDPELEYSYNHDFNATNNITVYSPKDGKNVQLTLSSNWNQVRDADSKVTHPLKDYYLRGYATSSIITGIWFVHSVWEEGGKIYGTFLMSKEKGGKDSPDQTNFSSYQGAQTTQYTYYQMNDLVKLDGIQTKGKRDGRTDSDEVGIISAIMTKILSTDAGKKVVLNALADYAATYGFTSSQVNSATYIASALIGTTFASNSVINVFTQQSKENLESIYYVYTDENDYQTLYEYLESLIENANFEDDDSLAMSAATDKALFRKILLLTLGNEDYDNDSSTTKVTNKDVTYFIYQYASYLRTIDPDITDAEIAEMLATATASDLTAFTELSKLDWTEFITTVGGDADASQEGTGYGSSLDMKALYEKVGNTGVETGYAFPIIASSTETVNPQNSSLSIQKYDGNNPKTVNTAITQTAASNNIGYFVGESCKMYEKTTKDFSFDDFYYPINATDDQKLPYTDGNGNTYNAPNEDVIEYLKTNYSTNVYGARLNSDADLNNVIAVEDAVISGVEGIAVLPVRCIWIAPIQAGIIKLVVYNTDNDNRSFRLRSIQRRKVDSDTSRFATGFQSMTITTVIDADGNGGLKKNKFYYFEYEVTQKMVDDGYEFVLTKGNANNSAYFCYIDFGTNGTDTVKTKYPDLSDIESNYDTYYNSLSNYAEYLKDNMIQSVDPNSNTYSLTAKEGTIILVKADAAVQITVSGASTYEVDGSDVTINSVSKKYTSGYRAFYLSGSTEGITYTISTSDPTINLSEVLVVECDEDIASVTTDDVTTITYTNGESSKVLFTGMDYTKLSSYDLNIDLSDEILETLLVIYPSMINGSGDNKEYYFFNDASNGNNIDFITEDLAKELVKMLANADYKSSTSALGKLISNLDSKYYDNLLLSIKDSQVIINMIKKIIAMTDENNYAATEDLIIAAYIGQDYLNNSANNQCTKSVLYSLLNDYASPAASSTTDGDTVKGFYQFINSDTTIDTDKFNKFLNHLGVTANLEGYGIFALASSHGIKNGTFIPDNMDLLEMDDPYNTLAKDSDDNSIISVTFNGSDPVKSTTWRDNTGESSLKGASSITYDTSDTNSVNYAFRIEMKQLIKSISTNVFELDLDDTTDSLNEIFASTSSISVDSATITFYVPSTYIDTLKTNSSMPISNILKAETATFITNNSNTSTINLTSGLMSGDNYVVNDALTVTAEDTTVYTNYSLVFVPVNVTFSVTSDTTELTYSGGTVTLTITCENIPDSFDFKPYFSIVNGETTYKATDATPKFEFNKETRNNGIVKSGTAKLVIDVYETLPGGSEVFTISAYGTTKTITISKEKNTNAQITKFEFEGISLLTNGVYVSGKTSKVKFGRAYDYTELTDYTSSNFYLSGFEISPNAKVSITATKSQLNSDGRIKYVIKYLVTPEEGVAVEYTHTVEEMAYFDSIYANIYKDGVSVEETELYNKEFTYDKTTYKPANNKLTYSSGVYAGVSFSRGSEPEYRIKYILNNFYLLGDITYGWNKFENTSLIESYAGVTASVFDESEPGVYKFTFTYKSTGTWNDGEYERNYTFPTLFIIKGYSQDALLHRLTFLDQSVIVGNTASVMKTNTSTSTSILPEAATIAVDGNEVLYNNIFSANSRDIEIKGKTIKYSNDSDSTSITDYYAIGTVSEANLTYYVPTFGKESHAQIYQYTTISKLQNYGGVQKTNDMSDSDILSNHDTTLIYVQYTNGKIYLVELDEDGMWTNVYDTTYDGLKTGSESSHYVTTFNAAFNTLTATTDSTKAKIDGASVATDAGEITSEALYMNYIGDPIDGHFWYVSYVIFSEATLHGEGVEGCTRYYHISIVDATNTIYFEVELYAPVDFATIVANQTLYMTIFENVYGGNGEEITSKHQISGYLVAQKDDSGDLITDTEANSHTNGLVLYKLRFNLQTLPKGYFYFYIDLPDGYVVSATTDMENQLSKQSNEIKTKEEGSFLPYTYILTKTIHLEYIVSLGTNEDKSVWAVATSDIYTRQATYKGLTPTDEEETSGE